MANARRGERSLSLNGETYTVRLTFNDVCETEEALGLSVFDLLTPDRAIKGLEVRDLLFRAVRGQHGVHRLEDAGGLLSDHGAQFGDIVQVLVASINDMFVPVVDEKKS